MILGMNFSIFAIIGMPHIWPVKMKLVFLLEGDI